MSLRKTEFKKTFFRMFKENLGRFFANTLIVVVSMLISAGLGALSPVTTDSFSAELNRLNAPDLIVKSTSLTGFSREQIQALESLDGFEDREGYFSMDLDVDGMMTRFYGMNLEDRKVNRAELLEGEYPEGLFDVAVEWANSERVPYAPGDKIELTWDNTLFPVTLTLNVTGVVKSSLFFCASGEPSQTDPDRDLDCVIYLSPKLVSSGLLPVTDFLMCLEGGSQYYFTDEYDEKARAAADEVVAALGENECAVLTLKENYSYAYLEETMAKVGILALIFPIFFVAITALVNFITIKKLVEDERAKIGCCASLGVPDWKLHVKYLSFALVSAILGCVIGLCGGPYLIPYVCYNAIGTMFVNPPIVWNTSSIFGLVLGFIIVVVSATVSIVQVALSLRETPAKLLQGKAPKPGKKILLEKIKPLWKILPFRYKSSLRNIFRRKVHMTLTVLSVTLSSALVFLGMALLDVSLNLDSDPLYSSLSSTMGPISAILIVCASALAVLIVYNLVDMNISERVREIATLKVLGYTDHECTMYTFREILIMAIIGIALGLPVGYGLSALVFYWLDFGDVRDVMWYSYLVPIALILGTVLAVNALLSLKVRRIDMNDSLKTLD